MSSILAYIPVRIAKLITGFTHNKLSDSEGDELDRWVEESDRNLEIFEHLTEGLDDHIFNPDDLIIETDELLDCWMIAGLIARQMQGILGADEKRTLDDWRGASPRNEELYRLFCDKANLQKFVSWLKKINRDSASGLN